MKNSQSAETTNPSKNMSYAEVLERRAAIKTKIEDTKEEYQDLSGPQGAALTRARETDRVAGRYKRSIQQDNERAGLDRGFMDPQQKERMWMLEQNADDASQHATKLIKNKKELNNRIIALQNEFANFDIILSTKEVLSFQEDLKSAKDKVDNLVQVIASHNKIIEDAQSQLPPPPENAKKREDLLAEIATGEESSDKLKELDQQIKVELNEFKDKQSEIWEITAPAQETIKGLNRRLTTAKGDLAEIESQRHHVLSGFMRGEANRLGKEYVEFTQQLVKKFEQLIALDDIMGSSEQLRVRDSERFLIPLLNVKACQDEGHSNYPGQFFVVRDAFSDNRKTQCQQAELDRITSLGIQL